MTVKKAVEALLEKGLGECALLKLRGLTHFFFLFGSGAVRSYGNRIT